MSSSSITTLTQEGKDLQLHVDLCAERYYRLEQRLDSLEEKLDKIENKLDNFKTEIGWTLIKVSGIIIMSLLSALTAVSKVAGIW